METLTIQNAASPRRVPQGVRGWLALGLALLVALVLGGCGSASDTAGGRGGEGNDRGAARPNVVATTTMIADLARVLGGEDVEVISLMKVGEDPHKYDIRPRDAQSIAAADLVLMNGLNLEATLTRVVENNAQGQVVRLAEQPGIRTLQEPGLAEAAMDPHAWMSVPNYKVYVAGAQAALAEVAPDAAEAIAGRAARYLEELDVLDAEIRAAFATVPAEQRAIVTSHDAFNYLAQEYGVEVHGVIGISTEQQPRPQDIVGLVNLVQERGVRALFIETSVSQTLNDIVRKVASETGAAIGGTLYSDSLDEPGTPAGSYIGMMRHNVRTIVDALRGEGV